jgi:hypothetical protein
MNEEIITLNGGPIGLTSTKKYALHLHLTIGLKSQVLQYCKMKTWENSSPKRIL